MLMKQTPKPSSSSMCYNTTVMIAAGMMCTVLLFPHSHSWLQLVDHCGISDTSVAGSSNRLSTLPKIILNNIFPYLEHQTPIYYTPIATNRKLTELDTQYHYYN